MLVRLISRNAIYMKGFDVACAVLPDPALGLRLGTNENAVIRFEDDLLVALIRSRSGETQQALRLLGELERREDPFRIKNLGWIGAGYGWLGHADTAFEMLSEAWERKSESLINLAVHPWYDCLRSDPRFEELREKMGLQPSLEPHAG